MHMYIYMNLLLLLAAALIGETQSQPVDDTYRYGRPRCAVPWELMPSGKCVQRFLPMATWQEANRTCIENQARLVEITSKEDDDYLDSMTSINDAGTFHMGVSDYWKGGSYHYRYSTTENNLTFKNWDIHEPSTTFHCGVKYYFGKWRMGNCGDSRPFVCERHCPHPWKVMPSGKCIQYFQSLKSWDDAQEVCEDWLGGLVEIRSKKENDYLWKLADFGENNLPSLPGGLSAHKTYKYDIKNTFHMGVTVRRGKIYYAIGQEQLSYTNWAANQPNLAYSCGVTYSDSKWGIGPCQNERPFVCETRFKGYVLLDACMREDLLALVSKATFPAQDTSYILNGLTVTVDECGTGYSNTKGEALCSNAVWKVQGCKENPDHCPENPPSKDDGQYPGWDGSYFIGARTIFAEGTYNCYDGYTRGNHKMVCQRNGQWSNPNCLKIHGYCQFPRKTLENYNINMTKLSVGSVNIKCPAWTKGWIKLWCDMRNKTHGAFSYENNKCKSDESNFCNKLPETFELQFLSRWQWTRWVFKRDGHDYNKGTTARVYLQRTKHSHKLEFKWYTASNEPTAHIRCEAVKINGAYEGRFIIDDNFPTKVSETVLKDAYNYLQLYGGSDSNKASFCKSIYFPVACGH